MNSFGARTRRSQTYSAARLFAQVSLGIRLQSPGDAAKQELLVRRFRFFAKQFPISLLELWVFEPQTLRSHNGFVHGFGPLSLV
jgi:hypothetical protein